MDGTDHTSSRDDFNRFAAMLLAVSCTIMGALGGGGLVMGMWARSDSARSVAEARADTLAALEYARAESNRATRNAETFMAWAGRVSIEMEAKGMKAPPLPELNPEEPEP